MLHACVFALHTLKVIRYTGMKVTLCPEKETKMQNVFFCNISYKTRAIVMKFGTPFPEKNLLQNDVNIFCVT